MKLSPFVDGSISTSRCATPRSIPTTRPIAGRPPTCRWAWRQRRLLFGPRAARSRPVGPRGHPWRQEAACDHPRQQLRRLSAGDLLCPGRPRSGRHARRYAVAGAPADGPRPDRARGAPLQGGGADACRALHCQGGGRAGRDVRSRVSGRFRPVAGCEPHARELRKAAVVIRPVLAAADGKASPATPPREAYVVEELSQPVHGLALWQALKRECLDRMSRPARPGPRRARFLTAVGQR
jgi:hypothetical protein